MAKALMKTSIRSALALSVLMLASAAFAQITPPRQDQGAIRQAVEQFLRIQSAGLPGDVDIAVGAVDNRLNLAQCPTPEAFLPNGSRLWGKTTVGVRCTVPVAWTIYVTATVRVTADYVAVAAPLAQGQQIGPQDLTTMKGDLTTLPSGIITDASQAIGRTAAVSLQAGAPLRRDMLKQQQAVQQGQVVKLISSGPGFKVSTEGRALANGSEGQLIQARTPAGQVVSGIAKAGGVMEVNY